MAEGATSHLASDCCAAELSSSACHSMPAVLTPRASSAARSPGMRETTQMCGSRDSMVARVDLDAKFGVLKAGFVTGKLINYGV